MAILKHIASKNADYGEAERYLIFQHDEYTQKPILDENGHMLIREEYYLDGINCDPFTFAAECQETNACKFHFLSFSRYFLILRTALASNSGGIGLLCTMR